MHHLLGFREEVSGAGSELPAVTPGARPACWVLVLAPSGTRSRPHRAAASHCSGMAMEQCLPHRLGFFFFFFSRLGF